MGVDKGRISISCGVERRVREEPVPAAVTPEGFQTGQGFVAFDTPELVRALEAAWGLPADGFQWTAAHRFAGAPAGPAVHAFPMFAEVFHCLGHGCFQLPDHFERGLVLEWFDQGFKPAFELFLVVAKTRVPSGDVLPDPGWRGAT